jgi:rhamnogalacturonyl hydrolase YesR
VRARTQHERLAHRSLARTGLGIGVLLRNWTRTNLSDTVYSFYGGEQADFLIHKAPHTADGACSQRNDQVQLWADFVAMAPPFLAYFGATLGGANGAWLVQYAYTQCALYRQYLRSPGGAGLWQHVVLGNWQDTTHWATGNGWAASGMMRTAQAARRTPGMQAQSANLTAWVREILDGAWPLQLANGTLLNVLDGNASSTFADTASTALLAATTFRYAVLANSTAHVDAAVAAMLAVGASIDSNGWLRGTTDPYTFSAPLLNSSSQTGSPEGQAFVLQVRMLGVVHEVVLTAKLQMHAAWRDYLAAGGTYNSTPSGTTTRGGSVPTAGPNAAMPSTPRISLLVLTCVVLLMLVS